MAQDIKIGLFGFGSVGQGLYDVLNKSRGLKADIKKICVKNRNKRRKIADYHFTYDKNPILEDKEINVVVELIDDAGEAYNIVTAALKNGKNVVTANKKMVAQNLEELVDLQEKNNVSLLYEASSCGSIPIIRNLEEYYDNELIYGVSGIFNGTCNFILSKMFNEGISYNAALKEAQDLGFAESDPTMDVGGYDAMYKLCIIASHTYNVFVHPNQVFTYGIHNLSKHDMQYAREKGLKIKQMATTYKINDEMVTAFVMPEFIDPDNVMYNVENEYNGVIAEAAFSDKQFFLGKGAGGHPTGSAVLSDISALRYHYKYEYKKHLQNQDLTYTNDVNLEVYLRYYKDEDLKTLQFSEVKEKYYGNDYNYVVGTLNLKNLVEASDEIKQKDIFIVNTGNKLELRWAPYIFKNSPLPGIFKIYGEF